MNSDFKDLLQSLHEFSVHYLVVGGYAVIHYAQPRYTKDIDIWLDPNTENASNLMRAFVHFGIPLIGVSQDDFASTGTQFSIGVPPCEIDFLTTIPGLAFNDCWDNKVMCNENDFPIHYVSKQDLIKAKKSAGRPQDLADIDELMRE